MKINCTMILLTPRLPFAKSLTFAQTNSAQSKLAMQNPLHCLTSYKICRGIRNTSKKQSNGRMTFWGLKNYHNKKWFWFYKINLWIYRVRCNCISLHELCSIIPEKCPFEHDLKEMKISCLSLVWNNCDVLYCSFLHYFFYLGFVELPIFLKFMVVFKFEHFWSLCLCHSILSEPWAGP